MGQDRLSSRQRDILALIEAEGAQYIEHLAARYGMTTQTLRRDINALCDLGYTRRFHGGVDLPVEGRNISVNVRAALNSGAKQRIARRIAAVIEPNSTVFMGIGSTVQFVAAALREHEGLRVVTNNIDVALTLSEAPQVEVHMTGGLLRHNDRDVVGADALRFFEKFYASYAVIGAGALDPTKGVLDFSYSEAQTTTTLIENSRTQLLAADVSKWTRDASVRVVPFKSIDTFFTDRLPEDGAAMQALADAGTEVVLCGEDPA
ncbi:DeoR family transcriptional regulator [Devosia sp. Root436]|jgi:DeoR family glycerol-3-phosphate regulon repressor|uniref:DeoR/GlpR family DNA-binding transcription regulator n=1 Tax=Devosia sp. Root436 TaxID=1736537 RepID=UPI0006F641D3|nr:DeoR/GlpR family DNA-binding transcription regulator [Devosia sp. Root436]KQX40062.1 DeoR family transcriptional regulator [Devosia sp. Root436]